MPRASRGYRSDAIDPKRRLLRLKSRSAAVSSGNRGVLFFCRETPRATTASVHDGRRARDVHGGEPRYVSAVATTIERPRLVVRQPGLISRRYRVFVAIGSALAFLPMWPNSPSPS